MDTKKFIATSIRKYLNEEIGGKIKTGVDFVYQQHPELTNIGTPEQYSQYLDSIFPNSKEKDIIYHGGNTEFETFRNRHVDKEVGVMNGIYLTHNINYAKEYGPKIKSLLINAINPLNTEGSWTGIINDETKQKVLAKGYDVIINHAFDNSKIRKLLAKLNISRMRQEIIVFEPEKIHILGSKQDIEGFKNFVKK